MNRLKVTAVLGIGMLMGFGGWRGWAEDKKDADIERAKDMMRQW